jgi:hypothetical protein
VTETFYNVVHSNGVIFQCRFELKGIEKECGINGEGYKYTSGIKGRNEWCK